MNILTFDIEEWFHILDNDSTKSQNEWSKYEERIHSNMDIILDFLVSNDLKATFFILGWIAKKYPEVISKIDKLGHEIGSHSNLHQLMYEQNRSEVKEDLNASIATIEDITGKKVRSFRAPGFSITKQNYWVFEILAECGVTHDASIFPAGRAHGGFPEFKSAHPSIININGINIKEFPINTTKIFGKNWIYSGGGYFRLTPYWLIDKFTAKSNYVMTYFHPRDFDPGQPIIKELSMARRFKSYVGLQSGMNKLKKWVNDYEFIDLETADSKIDWQNVPIVNL